MVYFVHNVATGHFKVGSSFTPDKRAAGLRTANGHELRLIGWIPGGLAEERKLQASLAEFHVRGEWYVMTDQLFSFIKDACNRAEEAVLLDQLEASVRALHGTV